MKRRVIKQANQAYTITLPIEWVRMNDISEKEELEVISIGRSLMISNSGKVESKKAKLDASGMDKVTFYQHLNSLYAVGFDEIEIVSDSDISPRIIYSLNNLIGYVLVSQGDKSWLIKDLGGVGNADLDEVFKRVFQSVLLFYNSAIEDIFGNNKETLVSLEARDKEVNKLCLYLQRAINKMSYPDPIKGRLLFTYSYCLESIGDSILRFWRTNLSKKSKKSSALKELAYLAREVLEKTFDIYYRFNSKEVMAIRALKLKSRERFDDNSDAPLKRHLMKIIEDASEIAQLTIMIHGDSK